jgi:hypothetical protein
MDASHSRGGHGHAGHDHEAMIADFRLRFWISAVLTIPVLALSPMIQGLLGLQGALAFPEADYVLFALSAAIFFYGGWPFLTGFFSELAGRRPGMMTLIALAISVAFFYSSAVVYALPGTVFFWELATLIDVMLLLGLVPKQISTGDRTILGKISKRGNRYLRVLFVQAAWVVLIKPTSWHRHGLKPWLKAAKKRLHHNVLAIALAMPSKAEVSSTHKPRSRCQGVQVFSQGVKLFRC